MNGFVDIHTHILPGVDDGAADLQEALALVRMAWQNGTRILVLTPHYYGDRKGHSVESLQKIFEQLQEQVAREMPDMQMHLGMEICYDSDVPEKLFQKQLLTMAGSDFVLLEFGVRTIKSQILMAVTEVVRYGFVPIIAHAERCESFRANPSLVDEVRSIGGYIQINADSVTGERGFTAKRLANKLLKMRSVDFVASDAHDLNIRQPLLRSCFLHVCKKYGKDYAGQVFCENACSVLGKNRN